MRHPPPTSGRGAGPPGRSAVADVHGSVVSDALGEAVGEAAKLPPAHERAEVAVARESRGHGEFAARGSSGDRRHVRLAPRGARDAELFDVIAAFCGGPGPSRERR